MMRSSKGKLTCIYTETQHLRSKSIEEDGVGERINGSNHEAFTQTVSDGEKIANVAGVTYLVSSLQRIRVRASPPRRAQTLYNIKAHNDRFAFTYETHYDV